jgi:hypothetical protein
MEDGGGQKMRFTLLLYECPRYHVTTRPLTYMKEAARKVKVDGVEVV